MDKFQIKNRITAEQGAKTGNRSGSMWAKTGNRSCSMSLRSITAIAVAAVFFCMSIFVPGASPYAYADVTDTCEDQAAEWNADTETVFDAVSDSAALQEAADAEDMKAAEESGAASAAEDPDAAEVIEAQEDSGYASDIEDTEDLEETAARQVLVKTDDVTVLEGEKVIEQINDDIYLLEYKNEKKADEALDEFLDDGDIEMAEKNMVLYLADTSKYQFDGQPEFMSYGPGMIKSYSFSKGLGSVSDLPLITVAVIDSGVNAMHNSLKGRIRYFDDDVERDYVTSDGSLGPCILDTSFVDLNGHGSHVAGIIAQSTLSNVKIASYKVANSDGETSLSSAISAVDQAVEDKVDVINMSLAGLGHSYYLDDALKRAYDRGIPVIAAAGNGAADAEYYTPGNSEYSIAVSAVDSNGTFSSSYSNYGKCIDFAAPGTGIISSYLLTYCYNAGTKDEVIKTVPDKAEGLDTTSSKYARSNGTSMAAPFVSACAAQIKSFNKSTSAGGVKKALRFFCKDKGAAGKDPKYGYGLVDMDPAMTLKLTKPAANSVKLTWKHDPNVSKYTLTCYKNGNKTKTLTFKDPWNNGCSVGSILASYTLKGLSYGAKYKYTLKATAKSGSVSEKTSYYNKTLSASTITPPKKVKKPSAVNKKNRKAVISWKKVTGASGYQVKYKKAGGSWKYLTKSTTKLKIKKSSLKKGKTYYFRVRGYKKGAGEKLYGKWSTSVKLKIKK